jgi:HD-GYP domain-containing protein (c-di-GMP phosphodiesterase class II)
MVLSSDDERPEMPEIMTPCDELSTAATTPRESLTSTSAPLRMGEIVAALSYALDITEGQPLGHAARSCVIGMHLAEQLRLPTVDRTALFYALLLKDAGCSSNAAKMAYLFGADDRKIKHDLKTVDWPKAAASLRFMQQSVAPEGRRLEKFLKMAAMLLQGPRGAKKLVATRCERGAEIVRSLGFPEASALAVLDLDEHWNGQGHPRGLQGEAISLLGRICCLAQTVEVFHAKFGGPAALEMAQARAGRWFDPQLVAALQEAAARTPLWKELGEADARAAAARFEPLDKPQTVDEAALDRIALGFAQVVDAKSPWTYRHSQRVAEIACGMGRQLGFDAVRLRQFHRTALLHDVGKLGVSNLVLDKPGKLNEDEFAAMKRHPIFSETILSNVRPFAMQAEIAGAHHERLDGRGYHRGIPSAELPLEARILMVADVYEALTAARPYREAVPVEKVLEMLQRDMGKQACPTAVAALESWQLQTELNSRVEAQLGQVDRLLDELATTDCPSCVR